MNKLTIKKQISAVFTDISQNMFDYTRDSSVIELAVGDFLFVGFEKPIFNLYAEMEVANNVSTTLTVEFFNGTSFESVPDLEDEGRAFTRSGFIKWSNSITTWQKSTVDGTELHWLRMSVANDLLGTTELKGLNIVFSDDQDLKEDYREVDQFLADGDSTFIAFHQSSKKDIVQMIRNQGNIKQNINKDHLLNITEWDFLNIDEIRQASKYLVLHKIFFNVSDTIDGKFFQLAEAYKSKFKASFETFLMTLDKDDDGQLDPTEPQIKISRSARI